MGSSHHVMKEKKRRNAAGVVFGRSRLKCLRIVSATNQAYVVLYGMVQRQAAMVSFVTIFRLLGLLFFVMLPLVLLMRKPQGPRKMSAAVE